jgi:hypothetical protein
MVIVAGLATFILCALVVGLFSWRDRHRRKEDGPELFEDDA